MKDLKELLKNEVKVNYHLIKQPDMTVNEISVYGFITSSFQNMEQQKIGITYQSEIDLGSLVDFTDLTEKEIIKALIGLEHKNYIEVTEKIKTIWLQINPCKTANNNQSNENNL